MQQAQPERLNSYELVRQLKSLQLKIDVMKDIYVQAQKLTVNDSIPVRFIKSQLNRPFTAIDFKKPGTFVSEKYYRYVFGAVYPVKFTSSGLLQPLNPSYAARPTDNPDARPIDNLYEQFRYDICVNIWDQQNKRTPRKSPKELLGLNNSTSYSTYRKQRGKYWRAISHDKHPDKFEEAQELFIHLKNVIDELDKDYKR